MLWRLLFVVALALVQEQNKLECITMIRSEVDDESVASRVSIRRRSKRRWSSPLMMFGLAGGAANDDGGNGSVEKDGGMGARSPSRRRLTSATSVLTSPQSKADIEIIKEKLGNYQHHGTGNPLSIRSPSTPKDLAVQNLAEIIRGGMLGWPAESDSTPNLMTERGRVGSFWTNRVRLTGGYGWTGLILPEKVDTSQPLPVVDNAIWFLVEDEHELEKLTMLLTSDPERYDEVKDRVVTVAQLAERLKDRRRSW